MCDVKVCPLRIIQNEISPKRSKKTKICQRSYSTVFNDLLNETKKQHRQLSGHIPFKRRIRVFETTSLPNTVPGIDS
jgi:hypothetical protein